MRVLLMVLLIHVVGYSQNRYLRLREYTDQKIVNQLKKKNTLVYQPLNNIKATSVLITQSTAGIFYWIIKNDSIVTYGKLDSSRIFSYKNYLQTGATIQEDRLKFVPPLICGVETENVIYEDDKRRFYFEYGKNITGYSPDARLEKYRREWIELIRSDLKNVLDE